MAQIEHKQHSKYHNETVRHHDMSEIKDIKLRHELSGKGDGKGSHRRKGANNPSFRNNYDDINWGKNKKV